MQVVEDVAPPRQRPADVERMPETARLRVLLVAQPRRLVGISQHPQRLRRKDPHRRLRIVPGELHPAGGVSQVVQRQDVVALLEGLLQLTEVEMRGQQRPVTEDLHIEIRAVPAFHEQTPGPRNRLRNATPGDRVDPHAPEPDQEALRLELPLRQPQDRGRVRRHFRRRPAAPAKTGRVQRLAQRQLEDVPIGGRRQALDDREAFFQVVDRFLERDPGQRRFTGTAPERHRLHELARFGPMMGEELGRPRDRLRKLALERVRDPRVHLFALAVEKRVVGGVPHQRVLERVDRVRWRLIPGHQAGPRQLRQLLVELSALSPRHLCQQLVGKRPADARANLRQLLRRLVTIEPLDEELVQLGGNARLGQRLDQRVAIGLFEQETGLEMQPGQFLDIERHAVGPHHQLLHDFVGQPLPPGDEAGQLPDLVVRQSFQRHRRDVGGVHPARRIRLLPIGPVGDHEQDGECRQARDQQIQQLQARGIVPVHVLDDHEQRLDARQRLDLPEQDLDRPFLLLLRRETERRVPIRRQRQQRREQRRGRRVLVHQNVFELLQLLLRRVVTGEAGGEFQMRDHRIERRVDVERRALVPQDSVRLRRDALEQLLGQPRLADPRVAADEHRASGTAAGQRPVAQEQRQVFPAPGAHQGRERGAAMSGAESPVVPPHAVHPPRLAHAIDVLERQLAEIRQLEGVADEAPRLVRDDDLVDAGDALESLREIRRLTHREPFVHAAGARRHAHDHRAGRDADADVDRFCGAHRLERVQRREGATDAALGVVSSRRQPEIDHHAVARHLNDAAAESRHRVGAGVHEGLPQADQFLMLPLPDEMLGQRGVSHPVAEHHREQAQFADERAGGPGTSGDGVQELEAVAQVQPEPPEVFPGEVRGAVEVDTVGLQRLAAVRQANLFQPFGERCHPVTLGSPAAPRGGGFGLQTRFGPCTPKRPLRVG